MVSFLFVWMEHGCLTNNASALGPVISVPERFRCDRVYGIVDFYYRCLTWTNLPPVCKLNPPAQGKCCPEPSCPPDYQIQYPLGYIPPDCPASCKPKLT